MKRNAFFSVLSQGPWILGLGLTFLLLAGTGCSSTSLVKPLGTGMSVADEPIVGDKFYSMQIKSDWGQTRSLKQPLPRPIPLQEALEKADAIPRFGSIEVSIHRVVPETGKRLIMKAEFDSDKNQILTHQNYDLRPNDHVIVRPASAASPLDGLVSRMGG